jgi:hypothetical protein
MTVYRPAPGVAVEQREEAVYLARLPDGPIVALEGTAAVIWIEACSADRRAIAERVADHVDRDAADIATDVDTFLDDLVAQGLLRESA